MIRDSKERQGAPIEIDLKGPDGNAFVLLGLAERLGRRLGYDVAHRERIREEMMLTDYEGLLWTFDREFGHLVTMWR